MNPEIGTPDAENLFKEFREVSVTEFFRKNKAHLGYSGKFRSLTTVIHELVTNSLDACEESGILPNIRVEIERKGPDHYRFMERDNGPGIPLHHVPKVFGTMLAGTKFHRNIQLRGQQGIGVAGVTMFSQMTTGKPMLITTSTGDGKIFEIELMIDVAKNNADIIEMKEYSEYGWSGTEVEGEIKGVQYTVSEYGPYEYLRRTALTNPHTQITFVDPEGRKTTFERSSSDIPRIPTEVKPHPKGVEVDDLVQMAKATKAKKVSSFLISDFSRISAKRVKEVQAKVSFDLHKSPKRLSWADCEQIINAFADKDDKSKEIKFLAPESGKLIPIGEQRIRGAILSVLEPEFQTVITRSPKVHSGGVPFQVELALAYGGNCGKRTKEEGRCMEIMRFANRAPLLFDTAGCGIAKAVKEVDWKRYDLKDFENLPVTIFVNVISTHIPYTSAGKQSISDEDVIVKEIKMGLMELGRRFQTYHSRKIKAQERENRRKTLLKYITEVAPALARITKKDENKIYESLVEIIEEKSKEELEQDTEYIEPEDDLSGAGDEMPEEIETPDDEESLKKEKTKSAGIDTWIEE